MVEGAAVRFDHPCDRRAERRGLAGVDRDPGAAAVQLQRLDVVDPPLAADHDRQPRGVARIVVQRAGQFAALVAFQQFEIALQRVRDALALGGADVGRVGVAQIAFEALGPDRPRGRCSEIAQQLGLLLQRLVAQVGFGELAAQAAELTDPHDGLAADRATHRLDGTAGRGREVEQERLALFAQRVDGVVHLQCRLGRQPGSEGEDALRRALLGHHQRDIARDLRPVVAGGPGDQHLGLDEQQRAQPVRLRLQIRDLGLQLLLVAGRPQAGAHQQDRGDGREADQRERRRENRDLLMVETEMVRHRLRHQAFCGKRGAGRQQCRDGEPKHAVARQ